MTMRLTFALACCVAFLSSIRPASADMVGHWSFDEADGKTAFDMSGRGANGTLHGNVSRVAGVFGGALSFDETDEYVTVPHYSASDFTSGFTIALWVNGHVPTSTASPTRGPGVGTGFADRAFSSAITRQDDFDSESGVFSGLPFQMPASALDGTWHHFALTVSTGGTPRVSTFVDGALESSQKLAGKGKSGIFDALFIGRQWTLGERFAGSLDEVRLYDAAMTPDEVNQLAITAVPSPSSAVLGFFGVGVLVAGRRRRAVQLAGDQ